MRDLRITRRGFVAGAAGSVLVGGAMKARAADTTIGFIYVGSRSDFGWNQSHALAAATLKKVPGLKVIEEENVPETIAVAKTIESMVTLDEASLIFGTSFGYFDPFMIDAAKKFPDVQFRHPTSLWNKDKHPMNLGGYFCYIEQAHYINGIAAGLSTTSNKLGYVAAYRGAEIAIAKAKTSGIADGRPRMVVERSMVDTSRRTRGTNSTRLNASRDRCRLVSVSAAPSV
jgi:simple sugar transport system substrate-binding protein